MNFFSLSRRMKILLQARFFFYILDFFLQLPLSQPSLLFSGTLNYRRRPNQQRTLEKLSTELRCNIVLLLSTDWARKSAPNVQKHACNVYTFQLSFHFAYHHRWLGRQSRQAERIHFFCTKAVLQGRGGGRKAGKFLLINRSPRTNARAKKKMR